jgi:cell wall-associated NlpC family hydrolase
MNVKVKSAVISITAIGTIVLFTIILMAQSRHKHVRSFQNSHRDRESHGSDSLSREDSVITFAKTLLGTPYIYASSNPSGFDCSGFVYYVFKHFNVDVSRSSYTIGDKGIEIDTTDARKGDIILFQGTDLTDPKIGHVGIIISEKGAPLEFIHASSSTKHNGVVMTRLNEGHYKKRFIKVIRVI